MCARTAFFDETAFILYLQSMFDDIITSTPFTPSYNTAPSQPMQTLLNNKTYTETTFGLILHWAKSSKNISVNARVESIFAKPSFKSSIRQRRAIIPVNGYYEWQQKGKIKQPYYITPTQSDYFALGAIWDEWLDNDSGEIITSSAIITTSPNEALAKIHDRMPVMIPKEYWSAWLDESVQDIKEISTLMHPAPSELTKAYPVSTRVNTPANNDASLILEKPTGTLF